MITGSSPLSIGTNSHSPANLPSCVTMDGAPPSGWFPGIDGRVRAQNPPLHLRIASTGNPGRGANILTSRIGETG